MTDRPKKLKNGMILIAFGVLLFWAINNYTLLLNILSSIFSLITPFFVGMCIAFILNVPMKAIERLLFRERSTSSPRSQRIQKKIKRPISLVITLLLVIGAIFLVCFLVIPEIGNTFVTLKQSFPGFVKRINTWINELSTKFPQIQEWLNENISQFTGSWDKLLNTAIEYIKNGAWSFINSTFNVASSIFSGVFNALLGIIFAVYILAQKETLEYQARKIIGAYIPKKHADRFIYICSKSNTTFSKFLGGQCTEAFILGSLCFIGMNIFSFDYSLVISILIAFTAFIPIVGAFIGTAVGAFLIFVTDPMKALWFIIFILILQQVEGNFIYPKVVGSSVGLPAMWVLLAVTVGGGLMGILGMFISVPLSSVIYCLIKEAVDAKIATNTPPVDDSANTTNDTNTPPDTPPQPTPSPHQQQNNNSQHNNSH